MIFTVSYLPGKVNEGNGSPYTFLPTRQIQWGNAMGGFFLQSYILSTSSLSARRPLMISSVFSQKGRS